MVRANPHLEETWEPLVATMSSHMLSWKYKFVCLGSKAGILNHVLNDIPIFFMSFLKMPAKVW